MGQIINAYIISTEKSERKRPLVRYNGRWSDNIKINTEEIGCAVVKSINLAQVRN
jgi:hypothetical protein